MQPSKQNHRTLWIALLCLCVWSLHCGPAQPMLTATMLGPTSFRVGQAVNITFSLSSASPGTIYILKWGTPLEGFRSMFYLVERDGVKLPYKGRISTRSEPTKDEYVALLFGDEVQITLDLTQAFDLSQPGAYTLKLATNLIDYTWEELEVPRLRAHHVTYTLTATPFLFQITP